MPISVFCPHCRNSIQFHESFASRVVACPTCAGQFQMPDAPAPSFQLPPLPTPHQPSGVPVINTGARLGRAASGRRTSGQSSSSSSFFKTYWPLLLMIPPSLLLICGGIGQLVQNGSFLSGEVDPTTFKDDPESFKGRIVKMHVFYYSEHPLREWLEINRRSDRETCGFYAGLSVENVVIHFDIPTDLDVPAVESRDHIVVTFRCTQGSLEEGNVVTSLIRHSY